MDLQKKKNNHNLITKHNCSFLTKFIDYLQFYAWFVSERQHFGSLLNLFDSLLCAQYRVSVPGIVATFLARHRQYDVNDIAMNTINASDRISQQKYVILILTEHLRSYAICSFNVYIYHRK